jgi:hypothetical protein
MKKFLILPWIAFLFFVGCDPQDEVKEYEKKKETPTSSAHEIPFSWKSPSTWIRKDKVSSIRLATYQIPGSAECFVSVLPGTGGGVFNNVNLWRQQVSLEPLKQEDLEKELQRIFVANLDAFFVQMQGNFKGKDMGETHENFGLLGIILPTKDKTFFIKMVGPQSIIEQEKQNFQEFYQSFQQKN